MNKLKIFILILGVSATIGLVAQQFREKPLGVHLVNPQVVEWVKPVNDAQWAEDVKKESLDLKFDYQLTQMKESLERKLPLHQTDLDKITLCPECIRWELRQEFEDMFEERGNPSKVEKKTLQQWIDEEFASQLNQKTRELEKVTQSIERIDNEIRLRSSGFLSGRTPIGTDFFIDCVNGSDVNAGTGTTSSTAWLNLDQFTENTRSAGDTVTLRRGGTACDNGSDLEFTSDGSPPDPIKILVDNRGLWPQDFASSSQTYTITFGSKIMTGSATISGISANDWIAADSDDSEDFAYEVASVSGTTLTLFLPYKGAQSGTGHTLNVMVDAPIWNTAAGDFQVNLDTDLYWYLSGFHVRGTDSNGVIEIDSSTGTVIRDMIFTGNGTGDFCVKNTDDTTVLYIKKTRMIDCETHIDETGTSGGLNGFIEDTLLDGNSLASSEGLSPRHFTDLVISETEWTGFGASDIDFKQSGSGFGRFVKCRNCLFSASTEVNNHNQVLFGGVLTEDHNGTIGDNRQVVGIATTEGDITLRSTTTPVRSGGGATSIEVLPSTDLSTAWRWSQLLLFERKIHTDTTSRDYQVFFKSGTSTGAFTASPTADELWIECEYWGDGSNNFRRLLKSTATMDFTTDSNFDQSITITCNPSQTGILYLRGWYAKTKETGRVNEFFVDPQIVITDT